MKDIEKIVELFKVKLTSMSYEEREAYLKKIGLVFFAKNNKKQRVGVTKILSSLFLLGFDKVDNILLSLIINQIYKDNVYSFNNSELNTMFFNNELIYDGLSYSLNFITDNPNDYSFLKYQTDEQFTTYLGNLDFRELIKQKIKIIFDLEDSVKIHLLSNFEIKILEQNNNFEDIVKPLQKVKSINNN